VDKKMTSDNKNKKYQLWAIQTRTVSRQVAVARWQWYHWKEEINAVRMIHKQAQQCQKTNTATIKNNSGSVKLNNNKKRTATRRSTT
jgi:hypothetical protein